MIINENKQAYQSQYLTLHKQFEQKLHLMSKATTDESNDESVVGVQGQKLLSIAERNDLQDSSHSDLKGNNYFIMQSTYKSRMYESMRIRITLILAVFDFSFVRVR